jgi:hypothetical protein
LSRQAFLKTHVFGKNERVKTILNKFCTYYISRTINTRKNTERLFEIKPISDYFHRKYSVSVQSLDRGVIPCRNRLQFQTYNLQKLIKYRVFLSVGSEHVTAYPAKSDTLAAEGKKYRTQFSLTWKPILISGIRCITIIYTTVSKLLKVFMLGE